jgi:chromosome segregation ATPase
MKVWQYFILLTFIALGAFIVYKYQKGELSFGPGGYEYNSDEYVETLRKKCPPPECDCTALKARIGFLERKLQDTINALEKSEALYESLYKKAQMMEKELLYWKDKANTLEAENKVLRDRLAALLADYEELRRLYEKLLEWCRERDAHVNACRANQVDHQDMLR